MLHFFASQNFELQNVHNFLASKTGCVFHFLCLKNATKAFLFYCVLQGWQFKQSKHRELCVVETSRSALAAVRCTIPTGSVCPWLLSAMCAFCQIAGTVMCIQGWVCHGVGVSEFQRAVF